jgi:DNA polymerase-3 subunit gamma/tau
LLLGVDPSRISDPEIAAEGERERLTALAARFSREDLLRAFEVLAKAETDLRTAAQPRYHLEMALLRWIHLRKLVSIEDLIAGASPGPRPGPAAPPLKPASSPAARPAASVPAAKAAPASAPTLPADLRPPAAGDAPEFKDAFLSEIRKTKVVFYQTVVAQAQRIDVAAARVTFTFAPAQRAIQEMFEQQRGWLESLAQKVAGRKVAVSAEPMQPAAAPSAEAAAASPGAPSLREQAMADTGVQALLEVFPAEIRDVEEM